MLSVVALPARHLARLIQRSQI